MADSPEQRPDSSRTRRYALRLEQALQEPAQDPRPPAVPPPPDSHAWQSRSSEKTIRSQQLERPPASEATRPTPRKKHYTLRSMLRRLDVEGLVGREHHGFRFIDRLDEGGLGVIFRAEQLGTRREVAVKVLKPGKREDWQLVERFKQEARLIAALHHPNVVIIHSMFAAEGMFCIAMELLRGGSVAALLKREGKLAPRHACELIRDAARALWAVAERGVVHRDINPRNLLLDDAGRVKVVDFGLARDDQGAGISHGGELLGTPAYMAPEQCDNASAVDHRADLYSLGVSFYQLLTGQLPFPGPTAVNFVEQHILHQPSREPLHAAGVSERVQEIVLRLLAKEPDQRFQTGAELATALEPLARPRALTRKRAGAAVWLWALLVGVLAAAVALVLAGGWAWGWW